MSLRNISLALTSVIVLAAGVPAFAQDSAIVQDSTQTHTITGDRNTSRNNSTQVSEIRQRGNTGNAGTSQRNDQLSDVLGDKNTTTNNNTQVSETRQRRGR